MLKHTQSQAAIAYDAFLRRNIEIARAEVRAGKVTSNTEVEALFAAMREQLRGSHRPSASPSSRGLGKTI